jgi:hypothetical protein
MLPLGDIYLGKGVCAQDLHALRIGHGCGVVILEDAVGISQQLHYNGFILWLRIFQIPADDGSACQGAQHEEVLFSYLGQVFVDGDIPGPGIHSGMLLQMQDIPPAYEDDGSDEGDGSHQSQQ